MSEGLNVFCINTASVLPYLMSSLAYWISKSLLGMMTVCFRADNIESLTKLYPYQKLEVRNKIYGFVFILIKKG
jgi:hypothetical protein